jgi:hypothetical protein
MRRLIVAVALAGMMSTAAYAQVFDRAPPEPTGMPMEASDIGADTPENERDPNKVICRDVRPPTGTRLATSRKRTRMCMTRERWEQQERDAQEVLKTRDRGICSGGIDGTPNPCSG